MQAPEDRLRVMAGGFRITQALYVVAKLGIADLLAHGPKDSTELAGSLGAHQRSLFRVMRSLAGLGVFTQDSQGRFGLTEVSQSLRTDHPESQRYAIMMNGEEQYRAAGELLHNVMTGETAFDYLYGKGHFEWMAEHPEARAIFNRAMSQPPTRSKSAVETHDYAGGRLVVDVGGGRGHLIASVLKSNPSLKGILFDLPQGVEESSSFLQTQGVADRCKIVTGSFFDSIPGGGDVYIMSRILHDWPDEKASVILSNCRKVIPKTGKLLIHESVLPEGDAPSRGKQIDLIMLYMLGGAERTENEWKTLLQRSGFALTRVQITGGPFDLIVAKPV